MLKEEEEEDFFFSSVQSWHRSPSFHKRDQIPQSDNELQVDEIWKIVLFISLWCLAEISNYKLM